MDELPLPLAGGGRGGGAAASQTFRVERISPTRIASFDAIRPPPQAGEVKRSAQRPTLPRVIIFYRASCTLLRKRAISRSVRDDQLAPPPRRTSRIRCLIGSTRADALARDRKSTRLN